MSEFHTLNKIWCHSKTTCCLCSLRCGFYFSPIFHFNIQQPVKPIKAQGSSVFLCKIVFFDCARCHATRSKPARAFCSAEDIEQLPFTVVGTARRLSKSCTNTKTVTPNTNIQTHTQTQISNYYPLRLLAPPVLRLRLVEQVMYEHKYKTIMPITNTKTTMQNTNTRTHSETQILSSYPLRLLASLLGWVMLGPFYGSTCP